MESPQPLAASNTQLVTRYANAHDQAAFAELVERFGPMVLGVSRRLLSFHEDADDATQLVFAELARRAGTIEDPEAVAGWLHTITVRVARRLRARRPDTKPLVVDPADPRLHIDEVSRRGELEILSEELDALPASWREPLLLRYFAGQSNEDAATQLGTTVTALEGRLKRGKNSLRVRLLRRGIGVAGVLAIIQPASASSVAADHWDAITDAASQLATDPAALTFLPPEPATAATPILTFKTVWAAGAAAVALTMLGGDGDTQQEAQPLPQFSTTMLADEQATEQAAEVQIPDSVATDAEAQKRKSAGEESAGDPQSTDHPKSEFLERLGLHVRPQPADSKQVKSTKYRGGLEVVEVLPDSSAATSALRVGDVIVGLGSWETVDLPHADYVGQRVKERGTDKLRFYMVRNGETLFGDFKLDAENGNPRGLEFDLKTNDFLPAEIPNFREIFANAKQTSEPDSKPADVAQALKHSVAFQFVDTPLNEVLSFLTTTYDIPIDIDEQSLEESTIDPASRFTFVADDLKLGDALAAILAEKIGGLDYVIRNNRLVITTTQAAAKELQTQLYDAPGVDIETLRTALIKHPLVSPRGPVGWLPGTDPENFTIPPDTHETGAISVVEMTENGKRTPKLVVTQSDRGHQAVVEFLDIFNGTIATQDEDTRDSREEIELEVASDPNQQQEIHAYPDLEKLHNYNIGVSGGRLGNDLIHILRDRAIVSYDEPTKSYVIKADRKTHIAIGNILTAVQSSGQKWPPIGEIKNPASKLSLSNAAKERTRTHVSATSSEIVENEFETQRQSPADETSKPSSQTSREVETTDATELAESLAQSNIDLNGHRISASLVSDTQQQIFWVPVEGSRAAIATKESQEFGFAIRFEPEDSRQNASRKMRRATFAYHFGAGPIKTETIKVPSSSNWLSSGYYIPLTGPDGIKYIFGACAFPQTDNKQLDAAKSYLRGPVDHFSAPAWQVFGSKQPTPNSRALPSATKAVIRTQPHRPSDLIEQIGSHPNWLLNDYSADVFLSRSDSSQIFVCTFEDSVAGSATKDGSSFAWALSVDEFERDGEWFGDLAYRFADGSTTRRRVSGIVNSPFSTKLYETIVDPNGAEYLFAIRVAGPGSVQPYSETWPPPPSAITLPSGTVWVTAKEFIDLKHRLPHADTDALTKEPAAEPPQ